MLKSMINPRALLVLAVLFVVHDHCLGAVYESSWIFRSEVTQGQNMWQAGTHTGHAFPYEYAIPAGWLQGTGISCAVQADPGTVVGNVEGNLKAQYQKHVAGTGKSNIVLSYNGINDESRIGTRFGVNLSATPRLKVDLPWPIPDINAVWKIEFVDLSMATAKDFTTGLGQLVTETGHNEIAAIGADLVLANAAVKLHFDQNIFFTPKSIIGTVTATHMATGTTTTTESVTLVTAAPTCPSSSTWTRRDTGRSASTISAWTRTPSDRHWGSPWSLTWPFRS
ncbi:MAG: hypothetical protein GXY44_09810 [Phycisphaerales bacterium]|nr:hypothetical protein [Phycisphaerales bacterium]